jgi:yeast amino acid transporter
MSVVGSIRMLADHKAPGFKYWHNPGPFVEDIVSGGTGKFVGTWAVMITATFSYQGAELVGVGAGETRDPSKNVPEAIRWTFWGILSLFIATIFFIGIDIPSDNANLLNGTDDASASPLVIAAQLAGIPVLPHIINAVLLTAVLSAANSNVYSGSRILVALANEHAAPRFMTWTNKHGIPYAAVAVTSAFGLLAFLNLSQSGSVVFDWFMDITATAGLITWTCINICHLAFMRALKAQGIARSTLPYVAPWQPWFAWFGTFFNFLILITNGFTVFMDWDTSSFFAAYISLILFAVMFIGHKIICRTRFLKPAEVDLVRGRVE